MPKIKILILKDGTEKKVKSKKGRYYLCEDGTHFRVNSFQIANVEERSDKREKQTTRLQPTDMAE